MNKKKIANRSARWILAFICTLTLFSVLSLAVVRQTLFNQEFMIEATEDAAYAKTITKEVNEKIGDIGRASNIPVKLLEGTVTVENTQVNLDSFIRGIYADVPFKLKDTEQVEERINLTLKDYVAANQLDGQSEQNQTAAKTIREEALAIFDNHIQIPLVMTYGKKIMNFNQTLMLLIAVVGVVTMIMVICQMLIAGRWAHRKLRWVAYIFGGAGLMMIVLPGILYLNNYVGRLSISSESMYRFITTYVNNFILTFIYFGLAALAASVLCWFASELMRKKIATK